MMKSFNYNKQNPAIMQRKQIGNQNYNKSNKKPSLQQLINKQNNTLERIKFFDLLQKDEKKLEAEYFYLKRGTIENAKNEINTLKRKFEDGTKKSNFGSDTKKKCAELKRIIEIYQEKGEEDFFYKLFCAKYENIMRINTVLNCSPIVLKGGPFGDGALWSIFVHYFYELVNMNLQQIQELQKLTREQFKELMGYCVPKDESSIYEPITNYSNEQDPEKNSNDPYMAAYKKNLNYFPESNSPMGKTSFNKNKVFQKKLTGKGSFNKSFNKSKIEPNADEEEGSWDDDFSLFGPKTKSQFKNPNENINFNSNENKNYNSNDGFEDDKFEGGGMIINSNKYKNDTPTGKGNEYYAPSYDYDLNNGYENENRKYFSNKGFGNEKIEDDEFEGGGMIINSNKDKNNTPTGKGDEDYAPSYDYDIYNGYENENRNYFSNKGFGNEKIEDDKFESGGMILKSSKEVQKIKPKTYIKKNTSKLSLNTSNDGSTKLYKRAKISSSSSPMYKKAKPIYNPKEEKVKKVGLFDDLFFEKREKFKSNENSGPSDEYNSNNEYENNNYKLNNEFEDEGNESGGMIFNSNKYENYTTTRKDNEEFGSSDDYELKGLSFNEGIRNNSNEKEKRNLSNNLNISSFFSKSKYKPFETLYEKPKENINFNSNENKNYFSSKEFEDEEFEDEEFEDGGMKFKSKENEEITPTGDEAEKFGPSNNFYKLNSEFGSNDYSANNGYPKLDLPSEQISKKLNIYSKTRSENIDPEANFEDINNQESNYSNETPTFTKIEIPNKTANANLKINPNLLKKYKNIKFKLNYEDINPNVSSQNMSSQQASDSNQIPNTEDLLDKMFGPSSQNMQSNTTSNVNFEKINPNVNSQDMSSQQPNDSNQNSMLLGTPMKKKITTNVVRKQMVTANPKGQNMINPKGPNILQRYMQPENVNRNITPPNMKNKTRINIPKRSSIFQELRIPDVNSQDMQNSPKVNITKLPNPKTSNINQELMKHRVKNYNIAPPKMRNNPIRNILNMPNPEGQNINQKLMKQKTRNYNIAPPNMKNITNMPKLKFNIPEIPSDSKRVNFVQGAPTDKKRDVNSQNMQNSPKVNINIPKLNISDNTNLEEQNILPNFMKQRAKDFNIAPPNMKNKTRINIPKRSNINQELPNLNLNLENIQNNPKLNILEIPSDSKRVKFVQDISTNKKFNISSQNVKNTSKLKIFDIPNNSKKFNIVREIPTNTTNRSNMPKLSMQNIFQNIPSNRINVPTLKMPTNENNMPTNMNSKINLQGIPKIDESKRKKIEIDFDNININKLIPKINSNVNTNENFKNTGNQQLNFPNNEKINFNVNYPANGPMSNKLPLRVNRNNNNIRNNIGNDSNKQRMLKQLAFKKGMLKQPE